MTFQFACERTGRPRTSTADIERRRSRYRDIRARLPMSNAEIAEMLGQHPAYVRNYPNGRVPTDETMDILEGMPSAEKRMDAYRRLREIMDMSDSEFASMQGFRISRIRSFRKKSPTAHVLNLMLEMVVPHQNMVAADSLEEHAEIVNDFDPAEIGRAMYKNHLRVAKSRMDKEFRKLADLESFEYESRTFSSSKCQ